MEAEWPQLLTWFASERRQRTKTHMRALTRTSSYSVTTSALQCFQVRKIQNSCLHVQEGQAQEEIALPSSQLFQHVFRRSALVVKILALLIHLRLRTLHLTFLPLDREEGRQYNRKPKIQLALVLVARTFPPSGLEVGRGLEEGESLLLDRTKPLQVRREGFL